MIGLALALAVSAANATASSYAPERSCDFPDDRQVAACKSEQNTAWDRALNVEYEAAMARLTLEQRPLLLKAQRVWVEYRDANCAIGFAHEGTVSAYLGNKCLLTMTRDRTKELHGMHDEDDD